jgi:hypothetical protein
LTIAKPGVKVDNSKGIYVAPNGNVVVEIGGQLAYSTAATEIGDATEASAVVTKVGTATVIGTDKVDVKKGGALAIDKDDIVTGGGAIEANKFSVATAWTAAKSGDLGVIDGAIPVSVTDADITSILALPGLAQEGTRKLAINSAEVTIGNAIATSITIPNTLDLTTASTLAAATGLTVNGSLTANNATLAALTSLTVGARGRLISSSTAIAIASTNGATVRVGNEATLAFSGGTTNTFAKITGITAGVASSVNFASSAAVFADLTSVTVNDAATVTLGTGTTVTFKPADGLSALTLGKGSTLTVGPDAGGALVGKDAPVNVVYSDVSLSGVKAGASGIKVGGTTDSVTLKSATISKAILDGKAGSVDLGTAGTLKLETTGTIATAGTGSVVAGVGLTLKGAGSTFTNTGDVLTITAAADGTTLVGATATVLSATGGTPIYAVNTGAAASAGVTLTDVQIDVSAAGEITLANAGKLVLSDATAGAGSVKISGTILLKGGPDNNTVAACTGFVGGSGLTGAVTDITGATAKFGSGGPSGSAFASGTAGATADCAAGVLTITGIGAGTGKITSATRIVATS